MDKKAIILGVDGMRPDALLRSHSPNIDSLADKGLYSWKARTEVITVSGSAWTSLLTGVHTDKHQVIKNDFSQRNFKYRSLFSIAKQHYPELKFVAHSNWNPIIKEIFEENILDTSSSGSDEEVTENLIRDIQGSKGDLYFLQLDDIDGAGHKFGYSPDSKGYRDSIEKVDTLIGKILDAIEQGGKGSNWMICLVSDHGGFGTSHGGQTEGERNIALIVSSNDLPRLGAINRETVEIVDIVPTIAAFLEIPPDSEWDGKSLI